jgi:hypothetical protein
MSREIFLIINLYLDSGITDILLKKSAYMLIEVLRKSDVMMFL